MICFCFSLSLILSHRFFLSSARSLSFTLSYPFFCCLFPPRSLPFSRSLCPSLSWVLSLSVLSFTLSFKLSASLSHSLSLTLLFFPFLSLCFYPSLFFSFSLFLFLSLSFSILLSFSLSLSFSFFLFPSFSFCLCLALSLSLVALFLSLCVSLPLCLFYLLSLFPSLFHFLFRSLSPSFSRSFFLSFSHLSTSMSTFGLSFKLMFQRPTSEKLVSCFFLPGQIVIESGLWNYSGPDATDSLSLADILNHSTSSSSGSYRIGQLLVPWARYSIWTDKCFFIHAFLYTCIHITTHWGVWTLKPQKEINRLHLPIFGTSFFNFQRSDLSCQPSNSCPAPTFLLKLFTFTSASASGLMSGGFLAPLSMFSRYMRPLSPSFFRHVISWSRSKKTVVKAKEAWVWLEN